MKKHELILNRAGQGSNIRERERERVKQWIPTKKEIESVK